MIRRLEGEGYLPEGATPNDLLDAIEQRRRHPAGMEEQARREFEARQQEEQANAPASFSRRMMMVALQMNSPPLSLKMTASLT